MVGALALGFLFGGWWGVKGEKTSRGLWKSPFLDHYTVLAPRATGEHRAIELFVKNNVFHKMFTFSLF